MLVLSRRLNEEIILPSIDASIQVVALKSGVVRLGFKGPKDLKIFRAEIFDPEEWENDPQKRENDVEEMVRRLMHQVRNRLNSTTLAATLLRQQYDRELFDEMDRTLTRLQEEIQQLQTVICAQDALEEKDKKPTDHKPKALVVEDDINECELLAGVLRMSGIEVSTANDGTDALEHLEKNECPDFVLMDLMLPRCDGLTAARSIRDNPELDRLQIFAVTGLSQEQFPLQGESRLIDRWFQKPLNPEVLLDALCN